MIDPRFITACLVTRGDVDLGPILATLPYGQVVVWDNSQRPIDLKTYGRFQAIEEAAHDVIYFQDDDVIFRHHDDLIAAYEPGMLVTNYAHGENPDGLEDVAFTGAGALVHRDLPRRVFRYYLRHHPLDADFLIESDFIFGALVPHRYLHLPFEIRDVAYNGNRLCDQPWQRELKHKITNQARALR